MWTIGWTDSRHEPHIHFLEMCELSDIAHFVIQKKCHKCGLTLGEIDIAVLENEVTVVVNCYDVVPPNPHYCKSDTSKCYCVEKFLRFK